MSVTSSDRKAVALFSGGLDSMLAIRILQEQEFEVEALNIRTTFDCCKVPAAQAATDLGVRVTVLSVGDDYLDVLRNPRHGYGKGFNPCVDCRGYMGRMAKQLMEEIGACVVVTGELLGQRPNSQKRPQLDVVAREAGLQGRLLRPLSAKLLPPTIPEMEGLIDREKLYDFSGRSRRPLIQLARQLGIDEIPTPSTGCALTEKTFVPRVRDLLDRQPDARRWDFELLNTGRHIRHKEQTKIVIGRDEVENATLQAFFRRQDSTGATLVEPENFVGPVALLVGEVDEDSIAMAGALLIRYTRQCDPENARVRVIRGAESRVFRAHPNEAAVNTEWL
jgi:tRNA(Ile)-lysidine synthase TilS/MesJ